MGILKVLYMYLLWHLTQNISEYRGSYPPMRWIFLGLNRGFCLVGLTVMYFIESTLQIDLLWTWFCFFCQEKTRQYEEERDKYKSEKNEWRRRNFDEVETVRQDLIKMTNKVANLQDEVKAKDDLNLQLR